MKAPRLRFFGIECSLEEVNELRVMSHYNDSYVGFEGRPVIAGEYVNGVRPAMDSPLRAKGLIAYDKAKKGYIWTKLGAMYLGRLARDNKHLRFYRTYSYCSRTLRMARKKNKGLWKEAV